MSEPKPATDLPFDDVREDKFLRQQIDHHLQLLKALPTSRERALAITKLQEAIMWLGMDLKRLAGGQTAYPESYDPSSPVVHPVADNLKL
jgi:hypothetical protein